MIKETMNLATEKLRANQLEEAETLFREVIAERPTLPDALHLLGCTLSKQNKFDEAIDLIRRSIVIDPKQAVYHGNLGFTLLSFGDKAGAMTAFGHSLDLQPRQPNILNMLGNVLSDVGEFDKAVHCFQQAIQLAPGEPGLQYNLGNCYYRKAHAVPIGSQSPGPRAEDLFSAVAAFQKTLDVSPKFLDAGNNLGNALRALGKLDEAIAVWRRVTTTGPHPFAHYNLGKALYEKDLIDDAVDAMQNSIRLNSNYSHAYNNLGNLFRQSGRVEESIAQFDRAIELEPDNPVFNSNRLYTLYYIPEFSAESILEEHRKWNDRIAKPLHFSEPFENDRTAGRKLRIGYVSPNFWGHCQAFFTVPLFSNHDHTNFEIFCYSDVKSPDQTTARLQGWADHWQSILGMSDDEVVRSIREDKIDILVDLTLHMAENRMLLFAHKPAPLQVTWLGYPGTTGLETMDYRLTDPYLDPPGETDANYSENSLRLPHTFWCFDREALESADIPEVNALPASQAGHITFGCLNNFCKVNQSLLELWKRVLDAVPNSRMLILAPPGSRRDWVRKTLGHRVDFVGRENRAGYMKYYHRIDIGLDTLPYNGHTTTLDSLWMGVPVVTLIGQTVVGRAGWSQLSNLDLTDLATTTPDQFVKVAAKLAADQSHLIELRRTLRDRMRASPLLDGPGFTKAIEAAYRSVWKMYCGSEK